MARGRGQDPDLQQGGETSLGDDLRELAGAFAKRWRLIALILLTSLALGVAMIWLARPAYTSSVDVFIDPRERKLVEAEGLPTGLGSSSQGADPALFESQIAILNSREVLGRLIADEHLTDDPEFAGPATGPLAAVKSAVKAVVYGPNAGSFARTTPAEQAMAALTKAVDVRRVAGTYVLSITVTTAAPEKSARLANSLGALYLSVGQNAVDRSAEEAAHSLEVRLAELRQKSEEAQREVEIYRRVNGLTGSEGVPTAERQLGELGAQVVSAEVAAQAARVALDSLRQGGVAAASSPVIADLRSRIDQARSEENILAATFGARHPRLIRARESRESLEKALDAELARVIRQAETTYANAVATETSLKAMLARSTETVARSDSASVKLRELEQTAVQHRTLYESFASKARQMREQVSLPATTARIISPAEPVFRPSAPRVPIILAIALFIGLVVGFGTAWILHVFAPPAVVRRRSLTLVRRERHQIIAAE